MLWLPSTFNPSDLGTGITLSTDRLTATGGNASYRSARGTDFRAAGKVHFEFVCTNANNWANSGGGLATSGHSLATYLGAADGKSFGFYRASGPIAILYYNDAAQLTFSDQNMVNGSVVAYEVDFDAGLLWAALDSDDWNNSGTANPATGTGGHNISAILAAGPMYLAMNSFAIGDAVTVRTRAASFTRAISSGFSAWECPNRLNLVQRQALVRAANW